MESSKGGKEWRPGRGAGEWTVTILAALFLLMVVALAAGTVFGIATGSRERDLAREEAAARTAGMATFTGIGKIRASTNDKDPAVVVASIAFPYDASDREYSEELSRKASALRAAAESWFAGMRAADLDTNSDGPIKAALRDTFNSMLSLGKVTEIWLPDFSVIK